MTDINFNIKHNEYLPLRDVVFHALRDAILTGDLQPKERLLENQLAEKLGVSRTPIREALRMLEIENLVELVPRRGAQVLDMSRDDIINILEIRSSLERLAVNLSCKRITAEQVQELKEAEEKFEKSILSGDREKIIQNDEAFHDLIFASTKNQRLIQIYENLRIQLYRYRMAHLKADSSIPVIISHHQNIIRAIENCDYEKGPFYAEEHIKYHTDFILKTII